MHVSRSIRRSFSSFKPKYGLFINGKMQNSDLPTFTVLSPSTNEVLCEVESADANIVNKTIEESHAVYESGVWSRSDVRHRAKVLQNIADNLRENIPRLADLEVAQTGRAVREMKVRLQLLF